VTKKSWFAPGRQFVHVDAIPSEPELLTRKYVESLALLAGVIFFNAVNANAQGVPSGKGWWTLNTAICSLIAETKSRQIDRDRYLYTIDLC
jgi:hypothetical protein